MSRLADLESKILEVEKLAKQNRPVAGMNVDISDVPGGAGRSISARSETSIREASRILGPFAFISLDAGMLRLAPGTVNQLIPDDPFDEIDCSSLSITYVKLHCETDASGQVNQVAWVANGSAAVPPEAILGAPPEEFDVLIAIVTKTGSVYKFYKTWPDGFNVVASPLVWIQTDRAMPTPTQTLLETWYSWNIATE